ncbi:MAG: U32 family peptidase, partial [Bacteroidales bacterium]|nr:U32 family peptidase [Bacteroidales bacterium]
SIADIERLVSYAHLYSSKIYVTLNTILFENELEKARKMAWDLYNVGVDAFIFQDMAFMEMDLPPVPLHASTQTNNYDLDRILFFAKSGVERIVLARELSLEQIKRVRELTDVELECFIHGALCVSLSGQCYLSCSVGNRSANRGACAQPCRKLYSLIDEKGDVVASNKYLLSLKDLSLSEHISELVDAGVNSLKIEGRLKDVSYVKNVTAWYRKRLDEVLEGRHDVVRPSFGESHIGFVPNPRKSFNRGTTTYLFTGKRDDIASFDTPKSLGEKVGVVKDVLDGALKLDTSVRLSNNDGLVYFDRKGELNGLKINRVEGNLIYPNSLGNITKGSVLYRNYDHQFQQELSKDKSFRKLRIVINMNVVDDGIEMTAVAESNESFSKRFAVNLVEADNVERSAQNIKAQLSKDGNTPFLVTDVCLNGAERYFFRASELNQMRRSLFDEFAEQLSHRRPASQLNKKSVVDYPTNRLGYEANVSNSLARKFYMKRGVEHVDDAYEVSDDRSEKRLMTTKHCIRYELGLCTKQRKDKQKSSSQLMLCDGVRKFRLQFDCANCQMFVIG